MRGNGLIPYPVREKTEGRCASNPHADGWERQHGHKPIADSMLTHYGGPVLKRVRNKATKALGGHFAIVASKYNARYVDAMLAAAKEMLEKGGVEDIQIIRVPGAFEIPVVAARIAHRHWPRPSAIICLGVILRGETTHARHIGEAVSNALAQIQIQHQIPIIHEVLLLENEQQAAVRCLSKKHNRGAEAAHTALEMARVLKSLP